MKKKSIVLRKADEVEAVLQDSGGTEVEPEPEAVTPADVKPTMTAAEINSRYQAFLAKTRGGK